MWVLIDNYDSFTYILYHYILLTNVKCVVFRNDEITIAQLQEMNPDAIIISPGPETPEKAGVTMQVLACFHNKIPIMGVCLGHQAIGMYFGAKLVKANYPMHGKISTIQHVNHALFTGIPSIFKVMRYHSLVLESLANTSLIPLAYTADKVLMALAHESFPLIGVQFHPESVGTEFGLQLINNWKNIVDSYHAGNN